MKSGWSIPCINIAFFWPLVIFSIILVRGNPLLEIPSSVNQGQTKDAYNVNISEVKGIGYGNVSHSMKMIGYRSEIEADRKLWTSHKREFSFMDAVETVFATVANVLNNIIGGESKNSRKESEPDDIKFWTLPVKNRSTDVLVSPNIIADVQKFLKEQQMDFSVLITDVQKTISNQNPKMSKEQRQDLLSSQGHSMTWKRYHRYGEIMRYLEHLAFRYPTLVELITIGNIYEGQPLKVAKVSSGPTKGGKTKPAIWIAGDGYEFNHTTDRLWRKTRSSQPDSENEAM